MRSVLSVVLWVTAAGWTATVHAADCTVAPSSSWKGSITFPQDPFQHRSEQTNQAPGWVKFTILKCDPGKVYFQDSTRFPFHYDFATEHLDPFKGMTREEYDFVTLSKDGQEAILGAVILPDPFSPSMANEFGIQLVRQDPYEPAEALGFLQLVLEQVEASPPATPFYFPTYEQQASAEASEDFFEANGFPVSSSARWAADNVIYAEGWALGRLKFFEADDIEAAYRERRLEPGDILLADGIPSEIPFVAGIISLRPSTPNSHVAILARNYGVPFLYFTRSEDADRARSLVGHRIVLRAYSRYSGSGVLFDVEGVLDDETIAEILELKELPPLAIVPKAARGSFSLPVRGLGLDDIRYVGGKAANYSLLLAEIPDNTREAMAFTFDLWDAFMDQVLAGGRTLREEIANRLAAFSSYPPSDMGALADTLHSIRDLIRDEEQTVFSPDLQAAVIASLEDPRYGFDPQRKIRFRSSTNMEDSDWFTGAGFYLSRSGCLADDLDQDDVGPSICDATREEERGVFYAIRRVFASFYRDNAFSERLRWGVAESDVGMAVLVHHSFPDPIELANGVATLTHRGGHWEAQLVSHPGATSVANPEGGAVPEVVQVSVFSFSSFAYFLQPSSLLLLGETALEWQDDYLELAGLLVAVGKEYEERVGVSGIILDFEYKKIAPDGQLIVKQVRRLPEPDTTPSVTPFLLNEPMRACTFQGERSNVFANHRLKSDWTLTTRNMWLTEENVAGGLYADVTMDFTDGCALHTLSDDFSRFPAVVHTWDGSQVSSRWRFDDPQNPRTLTLRINGVPSLVSRSASPVISQRDFGELTLSAEYDNPVLTLGDFQRPTMTESEYTAVAPCLEGQPGEILVERTIRGEGGLLVETSFYWPPRPTGPIAGYTAPLVRWVATRIAGLTAEPFVLVGDYSQSYRPEHHNFGEHFIFAPRLEPGFPAEVLDELEGKDVHLIHAFWGMDTGKIDLYSEKEVGHFCGGCTDRGDINGDAGVDISDGVYLLIYLFSNGRPPAVPEVLADLNGDGTIDLSDPIFLFSYLFLGGPAPPPACDI